MHSQWACERETVEKTQNKSESERDERASRGQCTGPTLDGALEKEREREREGGMDGEERDDREVRSGNKREIE